MGDSLPPGSVGCLILVWETVTSQYRMSDIGMGDSHLAV